MHKTKRLKYQRLIQNYKKKTGISREEEKLSEFNSKSCIITKFKEYVKRKNEINKILLEKYKADIFRKYKWYSHINRKKADTDLVRMIKRTFGDDVILCYGDWSKGDNPIKRISTPNIGLKRKLAEQFTIYNLDEYRTSCLHYKTEERCENLYLPDKKGERRKIHSVLTYKTESKRLGCINRDNNATNNMMKIVKAFIKNKSRPERFTRGVKIEKIKDDDPPLASNVIKPRRVQLHTLK